MTRTLVLLQFAFNIVRLAALAVLAWRSQWRVRSRPRREREERVGVIAAPPLPSEEPDLEASPAPNSALAEAERTGELVAEADARARFARFRARAAR